MIDGLKKNLEFAKKCLLTATTDADICDAKLAIILYEKMIEQFSKK